MTTPLSTSLATSALAAKRLAKKNQTRRNLVFLVGIAIALLALVAYIAAAQHTDVGPTSFVVAVALGSTSAGILLWRFSTRITPVLASCPSCGHSWEIKEGRSVPYAERMPLWDQCPGCGIPMRTALLERLTQGKKSDA
jgi:hypothetical protein